jgi:hypothetical protein
MIRWASYHDPLLPDDADEAPEVVVAVEVGAAVLVIYIIVVCGAATVEVLATEAEPPVAQKLLYHAINSCLSDSTVQN